jgi:hypothetical protein
VFMAIRSRVGAGVSPVVCESVGAIGTGFFAIGRVFSSSGRFRVGGLVGDW